jgi:SAM-dependent methyltransferase
MKNYDGECKGLIGYFKKFSKERVESILDVGCGTGNHSICFAKKGYNVVGIDLSKVMVNQAKKKAKEKGLSVKFFVKDMRNFSLKKKFDAVLCLFGTFGYCIKDDDVFATFKRIRNHLKRNSLFIFDFWPVYAYVGRESWRSIREIEKDDTYAIRIIDSSFNPENNVVNLKIKCKIIKNDKLIDSFQEEHEIRTFTPLEIAHLLRETGLKPLGFFKINWQAQTPYTLQKINLQTTNIACVAKNKEH